MKTIIKRSDCNRCSKKGCNIHLTMKPAKECKLHTEPTGTFKFAELLLSHPQSTNDTLSVVAPDVLLRHYI